MNSFFRKLSWLGGARAKKMSCARNCSSTWKRKPRSVRRKGWRTKRRDGPRAATWETSRSVQENTRAAWGWTLVEQLGQDLRYAFRTMAANRLFTLLAVLSLALGIGANTAIYSFMDAILLRSLPVADPESLVVLNWHAKPGRENSVVHSMSGTTYGDAKSGTTAEFSRTRRSNSSGRTTPSSRACSPTANPGR